MVDNPSTVGFVAAGVAAAVASSAVGGLSSGSSGAIGLAVVGACLAATKLSNVDAPEAAVKAPKLSKAQKKAAKKAKEEATAKARAERSAAREIRAPTPAKPLPEEEDEAPVKLSKSALRRQKKLKKAAEEKAAAAAAAEAAAAEPKKGKKKKKNKKKAAPEPEPEPEAEPEPVKKKKNKKKKKKVVIESSDDEALEIAPADDGWEVVKNTNTINKEKRNRALSQNADGDEEGKASAAPAHTQEVDVPSKFYGKIIGPGGVTRQALSDATGVDIQVPKKDGFGGMITVSGDKAACEVCANAIQELVTRGYCSLLDKDTTDDGVNVPAKLHGIIIGPRGANIKAIQEKTGTRVNMPDKETTSDRITVVGPPSGVLAAIEAIQQLANDGFSSLTHENFVKDSVSVAGNSIATLIGTGGSTIKDLQARTGAKINIPRGASGAIVVVGLVGEASQIAAARTEILALLKPPEALPIAEEWSQASTAAMLNLW